MTGVAYRSVVLDVDSTLCGVEGIDWLAERHGADTARRVKELTTRAMDGEIALERVYGERLAIIRPTRAEVAALAQVYRDTIAPGASVTLSALRDAGVRVVLISGGLRPAIEPLARELGVELRAVDIRFDAGGSYAGFDHDSLLTTQRGKGRVVEELSLERPAAAVGDGSTDVAMKAAVDLFVAYTGFVRREATVAAADCTAGSYVELLQLLRGGTGARDGAR